MDRAVFDSRVAVDCLDCLRNIAAAPDEVWLTGKNTLDGYLMIKYYRGEALALTCTVRDGRLTVTSLFRVEDGNIRTGLLIKKTKE
jgi:hypothetical protein